MDAARETQTAAAKPTSAVPPDGRRRAPQPQSGPPLDVALGRLWDETRALLNDQLLLLSLEARQAAKAVVRIAILGVVCAALVLGAWAVGMIAALMWLLETGMSIPGALGIVLACTLALSAALVWLIRQSMDSVFFPATLRQLTNAFTPQKPK